MSIITYGYGAEEGTGGGGTGGEFDGKIIQKEFTLNTISESFLQNKISKSFSQNVIRNKFYSSTTPNAFNIERDRIYFYLVVREGVFNGG